MQTKAAQRSGLSYSLGADALALALVVGLPLYMPNGYVGLISHKFFLLLRCVLIAIGWLVLARFWNNRCKTALRRFSFVWLWPVGLCACYGVAWFFAEDRYTALWGLSGRNNGLVLYLACTAAYLIVALAGTAEGAWLTLRMLVAVGCVVTVVSWLNYWMIDPLDAYYTFLPEKGELFLGTVGNINFYGSFLCLCVPLAAGAYLLRENRTLDRTFWPALLLCSGLIPASSDAAWLGCAVALAILCCTSKVTTRTLGRGAVLCAGVTAIALLTGAGERVFAVRAALRTVSAWLARPLLGGPLLVCALLAAVVLHRSRPRPVFVYMRILAAAALLLALAAFLTANLWPGAPAPLNALRFTERWASNRGYVWQRLWTIYTEDGTPLQKLFGLGGDAVKDSLNPDVESMRYMILLNGDVFDSAHNEFLQHLLCGGALGLVCWCGFLATAIWRGFRKLPLVGAALLGYAVQSFFSISMPGVYPLVFVLAATANMVRGLGAKGTVYRLAAGGAVLFAAAFSLLAVPLRI